MRKVETLMDLVCKPSRLPKQFTVESPLTVWACPLYQMPPTRFLHLIKWTSLDTDAIVIFGIKQEEENKPEDEWLLINIPTSDQLETNLSNFPTHAAVYSQIWLIVVAKTLPIGTLIDYRGRYPDLQLESKCYSIQMGDSKLKVGNGKCRKRN